jgi:Spy/CpxP family protein refolding chaperone
MNTTKLSRSIVLTLTLAVAAAFSLQSVSAQADRPQRGQGGPGGGGPGGPGGAPGGGGFQRGGGFGVNLDDKQRELLRECMQKDTDKLRELDEKLRAAQTELMKAVLGEKYDEKAVREKAEAVAKIQVETTLLRSKCVSTLAPTLTPEQRTGMEGPFGSMLLNGGFRGGFSGGPGGAPGGPGGQGVGRGNRGDAGGPGAPGGDGGGRRRGGNQ